MQIQVDLRDWIAYSLGPPGPLGLLLNPTPIVDANLQDTIYDVIDLALEAAMRNAQAYQSDLQAIDPFLSTHDLWVLGCPAAVYFNGHTLHFIDSIGDLTSGDLTSPADAITLTLRPRDDIKIKKEVLGSLSDRFGDAIASMITSKAAIDDHRKTGQRRGVRDRVVLAFCLLVKQVHFGSPTTRPAF